MNQTKTKKSLLNKILDKMGINEKFHKFSENIIDTDTNFITSPVD